MMTLLMVTFLMMFAISALDLEKFKTFQEAFEAGLGKQLPAKSVAAEVPSEDPAIQQVQTATAEEVLQKEGAGDLEAALEAAVAAAGLSQQVSVAQDERGVVVYVTSGVLFDSGSATLLPAGQRLLQGLAPVFGSVGNKLDIEGHTDDRPISSAAFPSNWELSTSRSTMVLRSLIGLGIDPARTSASGFADTRPRQPNDSPEHRAANRRVEVVVVLPPPPAAAPATPTGTTPAGTSQQTVQEAAPAAEDPQDAAGSGGH